MKSVICNWKMNPQTAEEARKLFNATKKLAAKYTGTEVIVAPPAVFVRELAKGYRGAHVEFGAQTISWEEAGSFTGEMSAAQMRDAGVTHVIIGHAERRAMGVTDEQVHRKVELALKEKMSPVIAVGEKEQDEHGEYIREVRHQIATALEGVALNKFKDVTIAYEPIWAIGAPQAPDANAVHQMMLFVHKTIADMYGEKARKSIRVIYGGAVNDDNAEAILAVPGLDGVLVGRAGLDPNRLEVIIAAAHNNNT